MKLSIIKDLKTKGFKITKGREALIDIFLNTSHPLTVLEINRILNDQGVILNKVTIYREIDFLLQQELVIQVDLRERDKRFEYNFKSHNHHLVCIKCKSVQDFQMNQDLMIQENKIKELTDFTVFNHSLEFYGICKKCNSNKSYG